MTERIERWSTVPRQMGGKIRKEVSSEDRIVVNCMFLMKLVNGRGIPGNGPVLLIIEPRPEEAGCMIFWELGGGPLPPVAAQGEGLGDGAGG